MIGKLMKFAKNGKAALLAATSLIAASAATAHAQNVYVDGAGHPVIEAVIAPQSPDATILTAYHDEKGALTRAGLWALAAASLAGLIKLIGPRNIARAAASGAKQAADVGAKAVRAVGKSMASPVRFGLLLAGLSLFAMTGIGFYDVEWIGGMIAGAALTGVAGYGAMKARLALKPIKIRRTPDEKT